MSKLGAIAVALLILIPLGFGGYEILKNVAHVSFLNGPRGPDACDVLTQEVAESVLGQSAQLSEHDRPIYNETRCIWTSDGSRFIDVDVGNWSVIGDLGPSSGRSNQGVGAGTYLQNSAVGNEATIARGSAVGRVARKGDVGLFVQAGHYGVFSGADAVAELALEDGLEQKLLPLLLPRL